MNKGMFREIAVVLDDHKMFADSFSALLEQVGLFESVLVFTQPDKMLEYLKLNRDSHYYLFLDYYLVDTNAIQVINSVDRIINRYSVIIISQLSSPAVIQHLLYNHVKGFICKTSGFHTVIDCINTIKAKKQYICPITTQILKEAEPKPHIMLSPRELEILALIAKGHSIEKTAELTFLSKHTIINHRRNMMRKANCRSMIELLALAREQAWI